ncbi:MAG TPA: L-threonylcarbamoyladenylate synthase [Thermoanaerobaculia bacterium]|jgi:tRNA threonylcarbamoyl adenosine modification protein (Sua5/YciO/YrdC/YwlC family)
MRRWSAAGLGGHAIAELAEILESGGVALLPTDTIYGLHALATNDAAVARIYAMKGRGDEKPLIVLGQSMPQLEALGIDVREELRQPLASLWPAPLTAILPLRRPVAASRGAGTLAVRVPALDWLRELLALTGPLASTSANRSGEPAISSPSDLAHDLQNALDALVDGGVRTGEASAIVDLTGTEPRFIREGESLFTQKVRKTLRITL